MNGKYDDMLHLPHPVSRTHPRMSMLDRAAQFSPFAALVGYEAAVKETARLTEPFIELDEDAKAELDQTLRSLLERLSEQPEVSITYYQPDERKEGGTYLTFTGRVKKYDAYARTITLTGGTILSVDDVLNVERV